MARRQARGWSQFTAEEKTEALRQDVNVALDLAEKHEAEITRLTEALATALRLIDALAHPRTRP
ncbi:MAG: hypothetical protein P4M09_17085 [Devosia sp.]|nr:hypothetical protein [Devosia sp.]